ncbi:MAG: hypothetical protein VYE04_01610 [Pseudomonadota bacterium]|nr:hypothetical protein [Pseudomonadota bacterium]
MSVNAATNRNHQDLELIETIAASQDDYPVVMINLNRYKPEINFPKGELYRAYMRVLASLLEEVGGRILWRSPVHGQPVGDQLIDEAFAAWYPTHQAFLDLPSAPGAKENFRLRRECVEYAVIHRCDDIATA